LGGRPGARRLTIGRGDIGHSADSRRLSPSREDHRLGIRLPPPHIPGSHPGRPEWRAEMDDPTGGVMYGSGGTRFLLYPSEFAGGAPHTVASWFVDDVDATVAELAGKGITFEQYDLPGIKTDERGIAELGPFEAPGSKTPTATSGTSARVQPANALRTGVQAGAATDAGAWAALHLESDRISTCLP
jgi:hypothetical protein